MKKLYFIVSLLVSGLSAGLNAQTLDVSFTGTCDWDIGLDASQIDAQSFTAGLTGALTKVSFEVTVDNPYSQAVNSNNQPISSMSFTAQIYNGEGCSGTLLSSQSFSIPFNTPRGFYDIIFSSPAQVTSGQKYTIQITPTAGETYNDGSEKMNVYARWHVTGCSGTTPYNDGISYVRCSPEIYDFFFKTYVTTGTLGTAADIANPGLTLYPNPAFNTLNVSGITQKENYTITDFSGKQISSGTLVPNQEINISKLIPGNYLLKLDDKTIKFIKK